jgi:hypothetical protein
MNDFKMEILGYKNNLNLIENLYKNPENIYNFLPLKSSKAFDEWKSTVSKIRI